MSSYQNIIPQQLSQAAITATTSASPQTLYTTPIFNLATNINSTRTIIKDIQIVTGSTITVTVYLVPSGGTAGAGNIFFNAVSVAAGTPYHWVGTQVILPGSTIQAYASTTGANIFISGGEAT